MFPLSLANHKPDILMSFHRARNAAGLLDRNYWTGTLRPRPTVDWYLQKIESAVAAAKENKGAPITILAHSAGGWLGRLFLLDFDRSGIDRFISLGSPHVAPPPGVIDQTRGILSYISQTCPGAHHDDIEYVTVAGRYIRGAPIRGPGGWQARIVGAGYQQVCGEAAVWGDGVVPIPAAHLEGALQLTLDGVYHSPLGSEEGSEASDAFEVNSGKVLTEAAAVKAAVAAAGAAGRVSPKQSNGESSSSYDSDEYEVTLSDVEEAAAVARPGPRLWYGSQGILEQWVRCIWTSEMEDMALPPNADAMTTSGFDL